MYYSIVMKAALFLLLTVVLPAIESLQKPKILKVPMIANLGGSTVPLGPICTEGVNLALNTINNRSDILPGYTLILDVADDKCQNSVAVKRTIEFFENIKQTSPVGQIFGDLLLPYGTVYDASQMAYVPPLFVGGICTDVCISTAQLPQQFSYIDIVAGCIDPRLNNRKLYPNFYRFAPSLAEGSAMKLKLIYKMSWNKIAILSDITATSYADALELMRLVQKSAWPIKSAEEFFISDPTDSINRIMDGGFRQIFASCYLTTCPTVACTAFQLGLYGKRIVWVFNTPTDLESPNLARPSWCQNWMIAKFREHVLYVGLDTSNKFTPPDKTTDSGVTYAEFNRYMSAKVPGIAQSPAYTWRINCFDAAHMAARILHDVETKLNKENETLSNVITDLNRTRELTERIRRSTMSPEGAIAMWGKAGFLPNTTEAISPPMAVEQVQSGVRLGCLMAKDRSIVDANKIFEEVRRLQWSTSNGLPPRSEPDKKQRILGVASAGVFVSMGVHVSLILTIWAIIGYNSRHSDALRNDLRNFNGFSVVGCSIILLAICSYPPAAYTNSNANEAMEYFCLAATSFILVGFVTMVAPLVVKLWISYRHRAVSRLAPINSQIEISLKKSRTVGYLQVLLLIGVTIALILAWYVVGERPEATDTVTYSYDDLLDTLYLDNVYTCALPSTSGFLECVLVIEGALMVVGVALALVTGRKVLSLRHGMVVDVRETGLCIYVTASTAVICLFALTVFREFAGGLFGITVTFSIASSLNVAFVLHYLTVFFFLSSMGLHFFDALQPQQRYRTSSSVIPLATRRPSLSALKSSGSFSITPSSAVIREARIT